MMSSVDQYCPIGSGIPLPQEVTETGGKVKMLREKLHACVCMEHSHRVRKAMKAHENGEPHQPIELIDAECVCECYPEPYKAAKEHER